MDAYLGHAKNMEAWKGHCNEYIVPQGIFHFHKVKFNSTKYILFLQGISYFRQVHFISPRNIYLISAKYVIFPHIFFQRHCHHNRHRHRYHRHRHRRHEFSNLVEIKYISFKFGQYLVYHFCSS